MKRIGCLLIICLSIGFIIWYALFKTYTSQYQDIRILNISPVSDTWHKYFRRLVLIKIPKNTLTYKIAQSATGSFYINSSFFDDNGTPNGLVIINDTAIQTNRIHKGGFFSIYHGKPEIVYQLPKHLPEYLCQTRYVGIKNGVVHEALGKTPKNKALNYRTVIGFNRNGDLYVLHSGRTGLVSTLELLNTAKAEGIIDALVFDSGSSLEVGCTIGTLHHEFKAYPDWIKSLFKIRKPSVYIIGHTH